MLLDTRPAYLIENSPSDKYWGCGRDGSGQNKLGVLLMQVRDELNANPDQKDKSSEPQIVLGAGRGRGKRGGLQG